MGIDAEMAVGIEEPLSTEKVKLLAFRLAEAFGASNFALWADEEDVRRALNIRTAKNIHAGPKRHKQILSISLCGRYYGIGYERGDLPLYLAIARWLRSNIEGATVYYGGDNSDTLKELTPTKESALWARFASCGHIPYTGAFDKEHDGPLCNACEVPMGRYGWGDNYAAWRCAGCGKQLEKKGGVVKEVELGQ